AKLSGFALQIGLDVDGCGSRNNSIALQLQRACPLLHAPLLAEMDIPRDILQREIELRREQLQVERVAAGISGLAAEEELDGQNSAFAGLLLERDQDSVLVTPRPHAVLIYERKPETRILGQREMEQPLVTREKLEPGMSEHCTIV